VAYRLGQVVEVDGCEAEEIVAAEPPDGRHAHLPPLLPFGSVRWRGAVAESRRRAGARRRSI
jgi:hypothetical protein